MQILWHCPKAFYKALAELCQESKNNYPKMTSSFLSVVQFVTSLNCKNFRIISIKLMKLSFLENTFLKTSKIKDPILSPYSKKLRLFKVFKHLSFMAMFL